MQANILLVDDRRENLLALRAILESLDCRFVEATSGTQALKYLLKEEFALILMDVQMPGLDGFETTTLIKEREKTRHIPIIFVTAISKEQHYIFKGYSSGAVDYIAKPFDPDILRSKVAVFIDLWSKGEQIKLSAARELRYEQLEKERELAHLELELKRQHLAEIARSQADLERFKETLDATLDGVSIFDATLLRYSYVNQGALNQLGYDREEMMGLTPLHVKPLFTEESFRGLLDSLITGEKQSLTYETTQRHKSGQQFFAEVFLQYVAPPLNSSPAELGGFISIVRDITERKRAERLLIEAKEVAERERERAERERACAERERERAERANHAKSEFIAGVSHELRTPLNAIIGFSKLLLNPRVGPLNEDQTAYTSDVVQSAEHLLQLINDILDLSKIESGKMALELEEFSLAEVLEGSLMVVRAAAEARNLQLGVELSSEIIALDPVSGDARKVKQVMYNLLSNAVKFTPDGGTIRVSARVGNAEENEVVIQVKDSGIGIAPEHQMRIFNAFEQVDSSYTRHQEGTGLGLALSKRIVELHGGKLWLESEAGAGSVFSFSLPLQCAASTETEHLETEHLEVSEIPQKMKEPRAKTAGAISNSNSTAAPRDGCTPVAAQGAKPQGAKQQGAKPQGAKQQGAKPQGAKQL